MVIASVAMQDSLAVHCEFNAAVPGPPFVGVIACNRTRLAVTGSRDPVGRHASRDEHGFYGIGAVNGESLIRVNISRVVGVSGQSDMGVGIRLQNCRQVTHALHGIGCQLGGSRLEVQMIEDECPRNVLRLGPK